LVASKEICEREPDSTDDLLQSRELRNMENVDETHVGHKIDRQKDEWKDASENLFNSCKIPSGSNQMERPTSSINLHSHIPIPDYQVIRTWANMFVFGDLVAM